MIFLRRRVALVPQHPILFTTSVFKNVAFPLKIRKVPKKERQRVVDDLLSLVDMRPFTEAKAHRLSGGETQRLAIARALACSPEVILLDEPTSSVDVENQITIERIIKEINREKGISVIFTSHDLLQASRLAHETVYLFEGRAADYTYENIFSGRIETRPDGTPYCRLNDTIRLPIRTERRGPVKISIHPDKVSVQEPVEGAEGGALQGRLIQLSDSPGGIRALVDVGIPVSVILSRAKFDRAPLHIGQTVRLGFPTGCIEIF
jgi:tungstate transport system ATP-binding protein